MHEAGRQTAAAKTCTTPGVPNGGRHPNWELGVGSDTTARSPSSNAALPSLEAGTVRVTGFQCGTKTKSSGGLNESHNRRNGHFLTRENSHPAWEWGNHTEQKTLLLGNSHSLYIKNLHGLCLDLYRGSDASKVSIWTVESVPYDCVSLSLRLCMLVGGGSHLAVWVRRGGLLGLRRGAVRHAAVLVAPPVDAIVDEQLLPLPDAPCGDVLEVAVGQRFVPQVRVLRGKEGTGGPPRMQLSACTPAWLCMFRAYHCHSDPLKGHFHLKKTTSQSLSKTTSCPTPPWGRGSFFWPFGQKFFDLCGRLNICPAQ